MTFSATKYMAAFGLIAVYIVLAWAGIFSLIAWLAA